MTSEDRILFFEDLIALQILLLLYRDNPDIPFEAFKRELKINERVISEKIAELIKADLIKVNTSGKVQLYTLTDNARMAFNRVNFASL